MEVFDLEQGDALGGEIYDICIVGAGAAGSYLASRLATAGLKVALLEAGGTRCAQGVQDCFSAEFRESIYAGALQGRAFGMGGSTSRWGGLLIPHNNIDAIGGDPAWVSIVGTVRARSPQVLRHLGWGGELEFDRVWLSPLPLAATLGTSSGLIAAESLFLSFRRKNLAFLLEDCRIASGRLHLFLHAIASRWEIASDARSVPSIQAVEARSTTGASVRIRASHFVIACGALESTRLLLEIERSLPPGALAGSCSIGRALSDHLSISIGDFTGSALEDARALFAPSFERGWLRSSRLIDRRVSPKTPRSFAHVLFDFDSPAFKVAKEYLQALQARRLPRIAVNDALGALGGIFGMAWSRFARNRLDLGSGGGAHLQIDIEQQPSAENRLTLSDGPPDATGRHRLCIDWAIRSADFVAINDAKELYLDRWSRCTGLPCVVPRQLDFGQTKPHDAYHPVGTLRMGSDDGAVVGLDLGVRGVIGLSVVSTSVLPSAGTANPTFSMLCLAEEFVESFLRSPK
jgi:glycine/D-amino acid oxidase-like deaminating enzyme